MLFWRTFVELTSQTFLSKEILGSKWNITIKNVSVTSCHTSGDLFPLHFPNDLSSIISMYRMRNACLSMYGEIITRIDHERGTMLVTCVGDACADQSDEWSRSIYCSTIIGYYFCNNTTVDNASRNFITCFK